MFYVELREDGDAEAGEGEDGDAEAGEGEEGESEDGSRKAVLISV